jgi:hypothetical protein
MTEEQIERGVEVRTNAIDRALMDGRMTQTEYDSSMESLNRWADANYERVTTRRVH